jgi:hypothetical protein
VPPPPSIEDDLGAGVGVETRPEIAIELSLGRGDDDEVSAYGVTLDRSRGQRRSSQIW